jgi:hypothetical protein
MNWIAIASSLGLVGFVVRELLADEVAAVEDGVDKLLNNPKFAPILIAHREEIEEFFDNLDKGVNAAMNQPVLPPAQPKP